MGSASAVWSQDQVLWGRCAGHAGGVYSYVQGKGGQGGRCRWARMRGLACAGTSALVAQTACFACTQGQAGEMCVLPRVVEHVREQGVGQV